MYVLRFSLDSGGSKVQNGATARFDRRPMIMKASAKVSQESFSRFALTADEGAHVPNEMDPRDLKLEVHAWHFYGVKVR
jgi:hypothetical protein